MKQGMLVGVLVAAVAAGTVSSLAASGEGVRHRAAQPEMKAAGAAALGAVRLPRKVMADGKPLAAGTYQVRVTEQEAKPDAVGQAGNLERWVEFVQGGQVKGREVATIVPDSEIAQVADGPRPARGGARVEMLKGNDYLRVWINRGGNNYLIHLPPA